MVRLATTYIETAKPGLKLLPNPRGVRASRPVPSPRVSGFLPRCVTQNTICLPWRSTHPDPARTSWGHSRESDIPGVGQVLRGLNVNGLAVHAFLHCNWSGGPSRIIFNLSNRAWELRLFDAGVRRRKPSPRPRIFVPSSCQQ